MISRCMSPKRDKVMVTFSVPGSIWAHSVYLVGDFNGWNRAALPFDRRAESWAITLDLDKGREYRYRYLLDGFEWCNDSNADKYVSSPQGGTDSVVVT
jgi:1,4-alpha-glucan branching enzyme